MDIETRSFSSRITIERRGEGDGQVIRGHAAVFDTLSENLGGFREIIAPGAFDDVLGDDVRGLANHNTDHVLGRTKAGTLRLSVDKTGLAYELDPPDTQAARDLLVSLGRGDIDQSSFSFEVKRDGQEWDDDDDGRLVRTITKVHRLYDVSPVAFPAYPDATVGLRSMEAWLSRRPTAIPNFDIKRRRLALLPEFL